MYMVHITKPCSHRPRNEAKLKIYLSIFCTTMAFGTPYPCIIHTHTFCLFLWTPPCIIHTHTPSACSYGHLHASSMHTHLLPGSFMHTCLHHSCIPSMQPVSQWQWWAFLSRFGWMGRVTSVLPRRELATTSPDSWQLRLWNSTVASWTAPHAVSQECS